jgi:hypothetical protein
MHVIEARLQNAFGPKIKERYELFSRPEDAEDARALAGRDWLRVSEVGKSWRFKGAEQAAPSEMAKLRPGEAKRG